MDKGEITEAVREALLKLGKGKKFLNGKGLLGKVATSADLYHTQTRQGMEALYRNGEIECQDWWHGQGEPLGRVYLRIDRDDRTAEQKVWQDLLANSDLDQESANALASIQKPLSGMDRATMKRLLNGLFALRENQKDWAGKPAFQVSARFLLGSSKMLDSLPSDRLRAFGIEPRAFKGPPLYVVLGGPLEPESVVLVENPHAFEMAVATQASEQVAWVATFGYGLSFQNNQHGDQLARIVEGPMGARPLVHSGNPPALGTLLNHPRIFFWGDYDWEALRIFERLKRSIPHLRLSGLYEAMRRHLNGQGGHPYIPAAGKSNQSSYEANSDLTNFFPPDQALDQEAIDPRVIPDWATVGWRVT